MILSHLGRQLYILDFHFVMTGIVFFVNFCTNH